MDKSEKAEEPEIPYLRIGINFFKIINQPLASKDIIKKIIGWNSACINDDHGADYRRKIPKYDSFCNIPDNINYKRVEGNSYNLYEPIEHDIKQGNFNSIEFFLKHIFGEQYGIGLDYLTIVWRHPTQILPILCLVSNERSTGKTTLLNLLKDIFGFNMTINTNEDFRNQFNSGWASKLIIGVDEVMLDKKEDTERIKNLSTTRSIKSEAKGKDKAEQEFYGKFILCSNNENDFIKITPEEIRFWVRKIPTFTHEIIDLRAKMSKEIPGFLYFLTNRKIETENSTRMWFTREQLYTPALRKVINGGASKLEKEIKSLLTELFYIFEEQTIKLTPKDVVELLKAENNVTAQNSDIIEIINNKWGYRPEQESKSYRRLSLKYDNDGGYIKSDFSATGRYYTFNKANFCEL